MRPAVRTPFPYNAFPESKIAVGKPERSMTAARSTFCWLGVEGLGKAGIQATEPPSPQETSAGTIRVAICPGAVRAAIRASAASRPIWEEAWEVRNHLE